MGEDDLSFIDISVHVNQHHHLYQTLIYLISKRFQEPDEFHRPLLFSIHCIHPSITLYWLVSYHMFPYFLQLIVRLRSLLETVLFLSRSLKAL